MQLEDYFDFETLQDKEVGPIEVIRVKGTKIEIEFILEPYLKGESPERIFHGYRHSLTLEEVYATITYYLHNKEKLDEYFRRGHEIIDFFYQKHLAQQPPEAARRIRAIAEQRKEQKATGAVQ